MSRDQLVQINNGRDNPPCLLVGNKADLDDDRAVEFELAARWSQLWNVNYIETSARTKLNVDKVPSFHHNHHHTIICRAATVGQLLFAPWAWAYTQPSILKWSVNRVPACLAGVKTGCVHLCRVEGVIPYGK